MWAAKYQLLDLLVEEVELCRFIVFEALVLEGDEVELLLCFAESKGGVKQLPLLVLVLALNAE